MAASQQHAKNNAQGTREVFQTLWGPGEMEQYLKLAVQIHNQENPEHTTLTAVTNNLTSSLLCSIVSCLLKELDDSFDTEVLNLQKT